MDRIAQILAFLAYAKKATVAATAGIAATVTAITTANADGVVTGSEWTNVAITGVVAVAGALGVYGVTNKSR